MPCLLSIGNEIVKHLHALHVLFILEDDHLNLLHGIILPQKLNSPVQITEVKMGLSGHNIIDDKLAMQRVLPVVMIDEVTLLLVFVVTFKDHVVELMRDLFLQDFCLLGCEQSIVDVRFDAQDLVEEGINVFLGVLDWLTSYLKAKFLALSV